MRVHIILIMVIGLISVLQAVMPTKGMKCSAPLPEADMARCRELLWLVLMSAELPP